MEGGGGLDEWELSISFSSVDPRGRCLGFALGSEGAFLSAATVFPAVLGEAVFAVEEVECLDVTSDVRAKVGKFIVRSVGLRFRFHLIYAS